MAAVSMLGKPRKTGMAAAFGAALGLEAFVLLALLVWFSSQPPTLPTVVVPLQIDAAKPEVENPKPKPELPKPLLPPPVRVPEPPRAQPALVAKPVLPLAAVPVPETVVAAAPPLVAVGASLPVAGPAPPPPPPAVASDPELSAHNARLTAAAQAAFSLPQVAIDLNFRGKARIGFNMRDASPSAITVVQTSGLGVVDRAAIKAVQTAQYPQPPAALRGKEIAYLIWVSAY